MIPEERMEKILRLIESSRSITVAELQAQLYVSAATVRRDLTELSKRGLIVRSFGGALSVTSNARVVPPRQPSSGTSSPIAETAVHLIRDGSCIFLSASSQTLALAKLITFRSFTDLTVVTDSMTIADTLCMHIPHLHCTGGKYLPERGVFVGQQAAEYISHFRFQQSFISCDGISPDGFLNSWGLDRLPVERSAVKRSRECILLCGEKELDSSAPNDMMELRLVSTIITDCPTKIPSSYKGAIIAV